MDNQNYNNSQSKVVRLVKPKKTAQSNQSDVTYRKRVCAYCRVSTEYEEQQGSYELQVQHYTELIKNNAVWEFAGVYADEGISGTSIKNRTEFLKMIKDCEDGKIDMIITKSISRFARNTLDCLNYIRKLKNLPQPVSVFFEKENIDTLDARSELILTILSSLAQEESRSTSENIRWAIQKKFQSGKPHCPTIYFMGYDKDENGNLVINEEQAKIIRRIFSEFQAGDGTMVIAKHLNKEGIKTVRGNNWTSDSIYKILTNEKYCGDMLMQKLVTVDFLSHKRVVNKGQQPQYFISDHHEPIIPKDEWQAVQAELKRRSQMKQEAKENKQQYSNKTVFSNHMFCSVCGETIFRRAIYRDYKGKRTTYRVWRCRTVEGYAKGKSCFYKTYYEFALESSFMDLLLKMKSETDIIAAEYQAVLEEHKRNNEKKDAIKYLKAEIKVIQEKLAEASSLSMNSIAGDIYNDLTIELTERLENYQAKLKALNEKIFDEKLMRETFEWFMTVLKEIPDYDPKKNRIPFRPDIFKRIVDRCEVNPKKLPDTDDEILYSFKFGVKRLSTGNHRNMRDLRKLPMLYGDDVLDK